MHVFFVGVPPEGAKPWRQRTRPARLAGTSLNIYPSISRPMMAMAFS